LVTRLALLPLWRRQGGQLEPVGLPKALEQQEKSAELLAIQSYWKRGV